MKSKGKRETRSNSSREISEQMKSTVFQQLKSMVPRRKIPVDEFCHNELFDIMGNQRRRYILCYLYNQNGPIECSELAKQIAAWENCSEQKQIETDQYYSVYNSLYQSHLPKLESVELIEYNRQENLVYSTDRMKEISRFIDSTSSSLSSRINSHFDTVVVSAVFGGITASALRLDSLIGTPLLAAVLVILGVIVLGGRFR